MRALVVVVLAAAAAGCAPSVRDVSLSGLNLADGATLASLQKKLPQDDRAALGTYALLHWPKSKFYCGEAIGGSRSLPTTIGEAIDQTLAYETALQVAQNRTQKRSESGGMKDRAAETELVTRIEQLVLERDMLYGRMGPAAATSPRGAEIKTRLAELRHQLDLRRAQAPARAGV